MPNNASAGQHQVISRGIELRPQYFYVRDIAPLQLPEELTDRDVLNEPLAVGGVF